MMITLLKCFSLDYHDFDQKLITALIDDHDFDHFDDDDSLMIIALVWILNDFD